MAYTQTQDLDLALSKQLGRIRHLALAVNPASIGAGLTGTVNVLVAGVTPQHVIQAQVQGTLSAGGAVLSGAHCTTPGTVVLTYSNPSAGAIDLAAHEVFIEAQAKP